MDAFDPQSTTFLTSVVRLVFYIIASGIAFYSFLAIYSVMRFSKSKITALTASAILCYVLLTIFTSAVITLYKIKF